MVLLARLLGTQPEGQEKIAVHQFMAALAEYKRGAATKANIVNAFNLTTAEAVQLQQFLNNLDASMIDRSLIHDVLLLGEAGLYNETQVRTRLSVV